MAKKELKLELVNDGGIRVLVDKVETLSIMSNERNNVNALKLYESLSYLLNDTYDLLPIIENDYPTQTKDFEALKLLHGLYTEITNSINLINTNDDSLTKEPIIDDAI